MDYQYISRRNGIECDLYYQDRSINKITSYPYNYAFRVALSVRTDAPITRISTLGENGSVIDIPFREVGLLHYMVDTVFILHHEVRISGYFTYPKTVNVLDSHSLFLQCGSNTTQKIRDVLPELWERIRIDSLERILRVAFPNIPIQLPYVDTFDPPQQLVIDELKDIFYYDVANCIAEYLKPSAKYMVYQIQPQQTGPIPVPPGTKIVYIRYPKDGSVMIREPFDPTDPFMAKSCEKYNYRSFMPGNFCQPYYSPKGAGPAFLRVCADVTIECNVVVHLFCVKLY